MNDTKTFSEFLVEQGLISADELVSLLIEQARELPTPAELAREHKLLNSAQLLTVFSHQMRAQVDFNKACQDLGLWTPEFAKMLGSENDRLRLPVVQLLQKKGKVGTEALVTALDSYLSQSASKPEVVAASVVPIAPTPTSEEVESQAGESALDHFKEFYSEETQAKIVALAKEWDQSDGGVTDALIDRVHGLVGAARFAKLTEIEELFKNAESNIRALADCATPLPQAAIDSFRQELVTSFEKGWAQRETADLTLLETETAV